MSKIIKIRQLFPNL